MSATSNLLIFGASARAAAFSALRAGLRSWCADLFADTDLSARCPTMRVPHRAYPAGFRALADEGPPGPWMYTGALENWPEVVGKLARKRRLWGNGRLPLQFARRPAYLARRLQEAGIPCPAVRTDGAPGAGRWLLKPVASAGGVGIRMIGFEGWLLRSPHRIGHLAQALSHAVRSTFRAVGLSLTSPTYYQEFIEGEPCAAIYLARRRQCQLLGMTRQLVAARWLHARPFGYCGNIGPLEVSPATWGRCERLGLVLASSCNLRGLFGVDCILRDGVPYPVEINPRYTASVEVLEYARGIPALGLHRSVFDPDAPTPRPLPSSNAIVGKAILFARAPLVFPADGPWSTTLRSPGPVEEMPAFADIPRAGERIGASRPVLTFFARADSVKECEARLREVAAELDRWLFGR